MLSKCVIRLSWSVFQSRKYCLYLEPFVDCSRSDFDVLVCSPFSRGVSGVGMQKLSSSWSFGLNFQVGRAFSRPPDRSTPPHRPFLPECSVNDIWQRVSSWWRQTAKVFHFLFLRSFLTYVLAIVKRDTTLNSPCSERWLGERTYCTTILSLEAVFCSRGL